MSDIHVLEAKLAAHMQEHYSFKEDTVKELRGLNVKMESKVSYKIFWTLYLLLVSVLITMIGYLMIVSTKTQTDVAFLSGKFVGKEVQIQN